MKKKAYISPALQVVQLGNEHHIMALSEFDVNPKGYGDGSDAGTKGSGDWDIWGNGSDSDYEDDY